MSRHRINDNGVKEKYCPSCEEWRSMDEFGYRADLADKKQCICRACVKANNAAYHKKKKETESTWRSTDEWLDNFTRNYNSEHPVENWSLEFLIRDRSPVTAWERQTETIRC
jgi:hypothetical protein